MWMVLDGRFGQLEHNDQLKLVDQNGLFFQMQLYYGWWHQALGYPSIGTKVLSKLGCYKVSFLHGQRASGVSHRASQPVRTSKGNVQPKVNCKTIIVSIGSKGIVVLHLRDGASPWGILNVLGSQNGLCVVYSRRYLADYTPNRSGHKSGQTFLL